jgi:LacI family transcriptional regulator
LITPHLTTIRQPVIQAGRLMAETLLQRLQGNSADRIVRMICPELLEGDSVAAI